MITYGRPPEKRAQLARQAVLAVLKAACRPMTTTEISARLELIGDRLGPQEPIYSLNVLERGPEVVRLGRVGTSASAEVIWQYRIPDVLCHDLGNLP
jgi:hypothetical protein